jgi:SEC-C motif-containing protein
MRSRYSAFSKSLSQYIIKTTHPLNIDYKNDIKLWEQEILEFTKECTFVKLTILEFIENQEISYVTFTAKIFSNGDDYSFTEKSKFQKINNIWYYLSGVHL